MSAESISSLSSSFRSQCTRQFSSSFTLAQTIVPPSSSFSRAPALEFRTMTSSFLSTLSSQPCTLAHILFMTALFLYQWNYDLAYDKIGIHYERVLVHQEWWRLIISAYSHLNIFHILFNMYSLWSFGFLEAYYGSLTYLKFSFILLIGSELLMLLAMYLLITFARREEQRNTYTIGYSGVVFGWMAIGAVVAPAPTVIFSFSIPAWIMPFVSLVVISIFIPNASFVVRHTRINSKQKSQIRAVRMVRNLIFSPLSSFVVFFSFAF